MEIDRTKLFRRLVVISTILFVILWMMPYVDYNWLSKDEARLANSDGYGSYIPKTPVIYLANFIVWLMLSVGLFFYMPIARTGFLVCIVVSLVADFFWGFKVYAPYEVALSGIVTLSDGAILVMAYLTSVSDKFEKA